VTEADLSSASGRRPVIPLSTTGASSDYLPLSCRTGKVQRSLSWPKGTKRAISKRDLNTLERELISPLRCPAAAQQEIAVAPAVPFRGAHRVGRRVLMAVETRWYLAIAALLVTMGVRGLMV
jgi:hypothetical protein